MTRISRWLPVLMIALTACGGSTRSGGPPAVASPGPALAVERFLQAANSNDLTTMMQLFGTSSRTIDQLDGQAKAEQRMYVLASLLRHDDFNILGREAVPGRLQDAVLLRVQLTRGDETVVVPHLVVRRDRGGWIIERVDVEPLTQGGD